MTTSNATPTVKDKSNADNNSDTLVDEVAMAKYSEATTATPQ